LWNNEVVPNSDVVSNILFHLPGKTIYPTVIQQLLAMVFNQGRHVSLHGPLMEIGIHSLTLHHICEVRNEGATRMRNLGALDLKGFMALLRSMTGLYEYPHHGQLSYLLTIPGPKALLMMDWLLPLTLVGVVSPLIFLGYYCVNPFRDSKHYGPSFVLEMLARGLITIMMIVTGQKINDEYIWPLIMDDVPDVTRMTIAVLRRLLVSKLSMIYLTYFAISVTNSLTQADIDTREKQDKIKQGFGTHESSVYRLSLILVIQGLTIVNIAFLMRHPAGVAYMTCAIWFLMGLLAISSTRHFKRVFRQESRFDLTSIASFITFKFNMTLVSLFMLGYALFPEMIRFLGPSCEIILPKLVAAIPVPSIVGQFVNLDYVGSIDATLMNPLRYLPLTCGVFSYWTFVG